MEETTRLENQEFPLCDRLLARKHNGKGEKERKQRKQKILYVYSMFTPYQVMSTKSSQTGKTRSVSLTALQVQNKSSV